MKLLNDLGAAVRAPLRLQARTLQAPSPLEIWVFPIAVGLGLMTHPEASARAVALISVSPAGGLSALASLLLRSVLVPLFVTGAVGWVLGRYAEGRDAPAAERISGAADLSAVPFLALILLGLALERLGARAWLGGLLDLLPHRGAWGPVGAAPLALRAAVAYLPTVALLAALARRLAALPPTPSDEES